MPEANLRSIYEFGCFDDFQLAQIWDFYVSKPLAKSVKEPRSLSDFGLSRLYPQYLAAIAGIEPGKRQFLRCRKMPGLLREYGLSNNGKKLNEQIKDSTSRFCCLQEYEVNEKGGVSASKEDPEWRCLLRHVRNSLAHGNTYELGGKLVMVDYLQGKEGPISGVIIVPPMALIDWIEYIDINAAFYFKNKPRSSIEALLKEQGIKDKRLGEVQ